MSKMKSIKSIERGKNHGDSNLVKEETHVETQIVVLNEIRIAKSTSIEITEEMMMTESSG